MDAGEDQREEFVEGLKLDGTMEDEGRSEEDESSLVAMEEEEEEEEDSSSSSDTIDSSCSVDSSDVREDASSSSSSTSMLKCSSSNSSSSESLEISRGPLYELSELMSQLPIKRGLSRYYDGRSQSYTSLASVKSVEDLRKKDIIISTCSGRKRLKLCKSYGGGLDRSVMSPRAVISKKGQNRVLSLTPSSLGGSRRSSLASPAANRPPAPVMKA